MKADICAALRMRYQKEAVCKDSWSAISEEEILNHPRVQKVMKQSQGGLDKLPFHGFDSLESTAKILVEHGLSTDNKDCSKLLDHIEGLKPDAPQLYTGIGKVGRVLDENQLGGSRLIRAGILAHAGRTEAEEVALFIDEAITAFAYITEVNTLEEIAEKYRGKYVFKQGVIFPSYYHLLLLAHTESWRTPENRVTVARGIRNLIRLQPLPPIYCRWGSQLMAPAAIDFAFWLKPFSACNDNQKMFWLYRMELLARLGVIKESEYLESLLGAILAPTVLEQQILVIRNTRAFHNWGAYTGLALEPDWRSKKRKVADITFRVKLLEKYTMVGN